MSEDSRLDLDQIRAVIQIASEAADIAELEVQSPTLRISVKKAAAATPKAPAAPAGPPAPAPAGGALPAAEPDHLVAITAPMVGTFYRAPSPDAPPFVSEGDLVEPGQTVCIIEAMKLFNEIQSEVRGRIARILVENAAPVEYGQTLMLVDTSADGA
ncbi:MAG: acetyl-CoA carboxylase biotin carboxyl carrier protein [Armatimonadota bacterium]|nr:acetyl-CoA carboxylase biotin carboxyl carrier protein [Armatimonadota bacterium]MDR7401917.1 acetyl-CoA carboxylase biotin carboxyl carrier protein [Armatimonadota bacterium]MDR7404813.1 acetyl-CoA carboxylase biotin carboxyl carrier protein [Armatimonadota bacterium]MDR7438100.1 acetyl-CoA carboxylase biotin carboxyl carrier protein [Armatimonadota bacterium]MDR7471532.1 acetyl-CoA carboxylase biotin carboxyl carrier protein [Armatimonadota bacterium]